jgi:KDO2-lipid IV(A) lauroyltransferase
MRILYWLFLLPVSRLPWFALYTFSSALKIFMRDIVRYRRKVITDNLEQAFPEKSKSEISRIRSDYYGHFCDLLVEWIKMLGVRPRVIQERVVCRNNHLISHLIHEGRSISIVGGHLNNWEWFALAAPKMVPIKVAALYKPLSNDFWERRMKKFRSLAGTEMIPMKSLFRFLVENNKTQHAMIYGSDQSPSDMNNIYWCDFFGRSTAVMAGSEKMAKRFGAVMVFGYLKKIARGRYEMIWSDHRDARESFDDGELTAWHTECLERAIREQPAFWLWSHRRWKHSPKRN